MKLTIFFKYSIFSSSSFFSFSLILKYLCLQFFSLLFLFIAFLCIFFKFFQTVIWFVPDIKDIFFLKRFFEICAKYKRSWKNIELSNLNDDLYKKKNLKKSHQKIMKKNLLRFGYQPILNTKNLYFFGSNCS